jgi:hypothetical protein
MRILLGKTWHIILAAIIICAVNYGIGYAIPGCCNELVDTCFQASEREKCNVAFGTRCRTPRKSQPSQSEKSVGSTGCCDVSDACCMGEGLDPIQSIYFNSTPPHYPVKANTVFNIVSFDNYSRRTQNHTHPPVVHSNTPLYIQIESILC